MTHEDFAYICLKIKSGNTSLDIPCCANCRYYGKKIAKIDRNGTPCVDGTDGWLCNIFRYSTKSEDFCSKYVNKNDTNL